MDAQSQRTAVQAMAAASENRTIADVLGDASNKIAALESHVSKLNEAVGAIRNQAEFEKTRLTKEYEALKAAIADQLSQLQQAASLADQEHASAITAADAKSAAASAAGVRESARIQTEIEKLDALAAQFGPNQI